MDSNRSDRKRPTGRKGKISRAMSAVEVKVLSRTSFPQFTREQRSTATAPPRERPKTAIRAGSTSSLEVRWEKAASASMKSPFSRGLPLDSPYPR